jgi:hypothetical protein
MNVNLNIEIALLRCGAAELQRPSVSNSNTFYACTEGV